MASTFHAAVTGLGLVTPGGIGVEASWRAIRAGRPAAARDPALAGLPVDLSCRVPGFDADALLGRRTAWRLDRYVHLALVAAREAVADAGLDPASWDGTRVGVVMGNALGGVGTFTAQHRTLLDEGAGRMSSLLIPMMGVNMVAGYLAMDTGAHGPNLVTTTACASATTAIGTARELLRADRCDIVLAGGAEAGLCQPIVAGFTRMGALSARVDDPAAASRPFERHRDGFVAAEGAGVLVLERPEHALARGARVRARVSGYGATADAHHATAPDPTGAGAEAAIRAALADAELRPSDVDHVNAHATSTPAGDAAEAGVLRRLFPDGPAVTSVKGVTGHALGAAGAIDAACAVLSVEESVVPPTANVSGHDPDLDIDVVHGAARSVPVAAATSNSFGFGGQNAVLVLTANRGG
ncbi:beta-ketoacyl-[acyl-carrier-protein] synthase family protein [Actinophytocola gossypii]|uniref:Beta-ketoacyl-[acyl-carrier-protein] synthase family protein n=1 Tax=Actinophytocola gossypii TaxID=2812003 RepID=A0ABT2J5M0_9PSEU|nr:beta-ketoacyl-[acyl-carrier-protein] synthase family protein [Actinophytocola gossypii]MCT2582790.1 beta-ketoacyl-[acyl-carrier-protein] synthase family protein [Actinophytocola gossypii]